MQHYVALDDDANRGLLEPEDPVPSSGRGEAGREDGAGSFAAGGVLITDPLSSLAPARLAVRRSRAPPTRGGDPDILREGAGEWRS